jgi:hypothetical protein
MANFTGYCKYDEDKFRIYENQYFIIPYKAGINYIDCGTNGVYYFVDKYDISSFGSIFLRNLFSIVVLIGLIIVGYIIFGWISSIYSRFKEKYKSAKEELEESKK